MKNTYLILFVFCSLAVQSFSQNKWFGGNGDYDDPSNWSFGTVPTLNDEVSITTGVVTFPANGTYYAGNFFVEDNVVLDFQGEYSAGADIEIAGDVYIEQSVTMMYDIDGSFSRWTFVGSGVNHEINAEGNDLNYIFFDEEDSQIELRSPVAASYLFNIKNGSLKTNNEDITAGTFRVGGGCSNSNCPDKDLDLGSSEIICDIWDATLNYGTVNIAGNYTIKAAQFNGGIDIEYNNVELTDFEYSINSTPFTDLQLASRNNTFNNLTISNQYDTRLAGDITVDGVFKVTAQNVNILITKESNGSTNQWNFNGSVDLVEDQGGCLDFTVFSKHSSVADDFTFHTVNSNLVFDWAIIQNIPTSGGGSFTINNGYVAGFNSTWTNGQSLASKNLYWIGGNGDWTDGSNWSLTSGGSPHGCAPSISDNAIFDENSFTSSTQAVSLLYSEDNYCHSFIWKPMSESATIRDFSFGLSVHPNLFISGNISIEMPDIFDFDGADLFLVANDEFGISSDAPLPTCRILSSSAGYLQEQDLVFDGSLYFNAGYYATEGYDLQINGSLLCESQDPKQIEFNGSIINVTNTANFGDIYGNGNVTVNAGTSHIICNRFSSVTNNFDVVESNSPTSYFINPDGDNLFIRKFILNGGNIDIKGAGIDVDSLIFNSDNASLGLDYFYTSNIYKDIVINTTTGNHAEIEGKFVGGFTAKPTINFPKLNTCILGPIEIKNIIASSPSPVNVPEGIDNGGNTNFDFTANPSYTGTLYWIAGDGEMMEPINWSTRSGGCPAGESPSSADQLIFDQNGFADVTDTVRVSSGAVMNKVRWENIEGSGNFAVLHTTSTMYAEEWVVEDTHLKMSSPSNRSLFLEHHLHVDGSALEVDFMSLLIGSQPSTLDEVAFHVKGSSVVVGDDLRVFLRGQASDLNLPTFKVDPSAGFFGNLNKLHTFPPTSGQPLRDFTIEANDANFDLISLFLSSTNSQTININDDIQCDEFRMSNHNGVVVIKNGHSLKVNE